MDGHNLEDRDWLFGLMIQSKLFCPRERGNKVFVGADYNQSMEQQREMTMKRINYLYEHGVFEGWLTKKGVESELRKFSFLEIMGIFDHSLAIKIGVHFFLWYVIFLHFIWFCGVTWHLFCCLNIQTSLMTLQMRTI